MGFLHRAAINTTKYGISHDPYIAFNALRPQILLMLSTAVIGGKIIGNLAGVARRRATIISRNQIVTQKSILAYI
jgi:hypothetical protein